MKNTEIKEKVEDKGDISFLQSSEKNVGQHFKISNFKIIFFSIIISETVYSKSEYLYFTCNHPCEFIMARYIQKNHKCVSGDGNGLDGNDKWERKV